jgi:hypothetical protein
MARPTPAQLQEARRAKQEERRRQEEIAERLAREEKAAADARRAEMAKRFSLLSANRSKAVQLASVLKGLYEEMDKLTRKAPADEVTELALRRVNDAVARGKELMAGDEFIDSIDLFVAAGERPEHRDVLLILSELRQGMARLDSEHSELERMMRR